MAFCLRSPGRSETDSCSRGEGSRQRLDESGERAERRRNRQERREVKRKYLEYIDQGASWGKPAACVMLEFAIGALCLQSVESHLLW